MLNELARLGDPRPSDRKAPHPPHTGVVIAAPLPLREVLSKRPISAVASIDRSREPSPAAVVSIRVELLRQEPPPAVVEAVEATPERTLAAEPPPQPTAAEPFEMLASSRAAAAYTFQRSLAEPAGLVAAPYQRIDIRA